MPFKRFYYETITLTRHEIHIQLLYIKWDTKVSYINYDWGDQDEFRSFVKCDLVIKKNAIFLTKSFYIAFEILRYKQPLNILLLTFVIKHIVSHLKSLLQANIIQFLNWSVSQHP